MKQIHAGDVVKFEYDADEGTIEFYMGDILLGKGSGKKGSATMYPVVCLQYKNNSITLL